MGKLPLFFEKGVVSMGESNSELTHSIMPIMSHESDMKRNKMGFQNHCLAEFKIKK